jgi:hypothetical protein
MHLQLTGGAHLTTFSLDLARRTDGSPAAAGRLDGVSEVEWRVRVADRTLVFAPSLGPVGDDCTEAMMTDAYTSQDDLWEVQTDDGQLHTITLDQLDAAFEAEMVSASTLVRPRGATSWQPLSVMAGLDDADAPAETATTSLAPMVVASDAHASVIPGPVVANGPPPFDLDLDEHALRPKRGKAIFAVVGGVAALAFIAALGVTKLTTEKAAAAGGVTQAVAAPAALVPAAAPTDTATPSERLTEEQKKALLDADKARAAARKAKAPPPSSVKAARRNKGTSSSPFVQGGNKYDPLNGAL